MDLTSIYDKYSPRLNRGWDSARDQAGFLSVSSWTWRVYLRILKYTRVIYDSGSVPEKSIVSPRETSPNKFLRLDRLLIPGWRTSFFLYHPGLRECMGITQVSSFGQVADSGVAHLTNSIRDVPSTNSTIQH